MKTRERITALFGTCNEQLVKAFKQAYYCYCDYVGCLENGLADNDEDSEEYKSYYADLKDGEGLRNYVYGSFFGDTIYGEGYAQSCSAAKKYLQNIRFAGEHNLKVIADWIVAIKNKRAEVDCGWNVVDFNNAYPEHAQQVA